MWTPSLPVSSSLFPSDVLAALSTWSQGCARAGWGQGASCDPGRERLGFERRPWQIHEGSKSIDWRASARRGELLVRQREREVGGELQLVLDRSASVQPGPTRRDADQRRIALIWGWLHLEAGGRLRLLTETFDGKFSGRGDCLTLLQALTALPEPSGTGIPHCTPAQQTLFLTDPWVRFLNPLPPQTSVLALVLQQEDRPPHGGLRLRDVESGDQLEVQFTPERYRKAWEDYLEQKRVELRNKGVQFMEYRLPASEATALTLLKELKESGLV